MFIIFTYKTIFTTVSIVVVFVVIINYNFVTQAARSQFHFNYFYMSGHPVIFWLARAELMVYWVLF